MELMTLNAGFHPVKPVENYNSLLWTERYSVAGDCQIVTSDIRRMLQLLPLESYLGIRESPVPMIVESHKISKAKGRAPELTITGRSFETVLERRGSALTLPTDTPVTEPWRITADIYKSSDAAYKLIRRIIGDDNVRSDLAPVDPVVEEDAIPEINLPLPTDYSTENSTTYDIRSGDLYGVAIELIRANNHGLRSIRPSPYGDKITTDIEIYNGANLTGEGPNGDPANVVVFDAKFDQFDDATYLLSMQGSANVAYVFGPNGSTIQLKNAGPPPSGLARRVLQVDESSNAALSTEELRQNKGLVELYKNNAIAIFDGEVAFQVAEKFNKPLAQGGYGLGDIIKLNGEYGLSRTVRVSEFIRSEDPSGSKAYPAFQVVDE